MPPNESTINDTLKAVVRAVTALGSGLREQQQLQIEQHAEIMRELAVIKGAAIPQSPPNGARKRGDDDSITFKFGESHAQLSPEHARLVRPVFVRVLLWVASAAGLGKLFHVLGGP